MIIDGRVLEVRTVDARDKAPRRRMGLVFDSAVDVAQILGDAGVTNLETGQDGASCIVTMDVTGSMGEVINWAAGHTVLDMTSEPISLDDLFLEAYGGSHEGNDEGGRSEG